MTGQKAKEMSEWLLKLLVPLFIAICSLAMQAAASELRALKTQIEAFQANIESLKLDVVALKTRLDYHESSRRQ